MAAHRERGGSSQGKREREDLHFSGETSGFHHGSFHTSAHSLDWFWPTYTLPSWTFQVTSVKSVCVTTILLATQPTDQSSTSTNSGLLFQQSKGKDSLHLAPQYPSLILLLLDTARFSEKVVSHNCHASSRHDGFQNLQRRRSKQLEVSSRWAASFICFCRGNRLEKHACASRWDSISLVTFSRP